MDYEVFVNECRSYKKYLDSKEKIIDQIELIIYEMTGVKGIRYDKQPMSFNASLSEELRNKLSERLDEKEKELDRTQMKIDDIERNLKRLPEDIKDLCIMLFVEKKTFQDAGKTIGYSDGGLWYRIKKEVEKI